jgi:hypothetical protein
VYRSLLARQGRVALCCFGSMSASEAAQIVRFYRLADSVRADVSDGGVLAIGVDQS